MRVQSCVLGFALNNSGLHELHCRLAVLHVFVLLAAQLIICFFALLLDNAITGDCLDDVFEFLLVKEIMKAMNCNFLPAIYYN